MLHVRVVGSGQAVVLLHAFPMNSRMWEPQIRGLRDRARLIVPDLPGFGLSGPPIAEPSLDYYAREVVSLIDQLGVDQVSVVGLSMGGYVAFRLLGLLGSRLSALALADTRATPDTPEAIAGRHELAAEVEAEGVDAAASEFLAKVLGTTTLRMQPQLIDRVRAIMLENTVAGVAGALRAMAARPDSTAMLPTIACPVVCIVGEEDTLTPPDIARAMAARIRDAWTEVIPQAGHLANLEAPDAFNEALVTLLDQRR